jgi:hypothetical protein
VTKVQSLNDLPAVREYLVRIGAEARSLKTAVVKETHGEYWTDVAVIRFGPGGEVSCSTLEHGPTEAEQSSIMHEFSRVDFPKIKRLSRIVHAPDMLKEADPANIFEFRTLNGEEIIMVQVRMSGTGPDGEAMKYYVPFTYWDDDQWRMSEPDGDLPLYGLDQLPEHKVAFVHEGAKGAKLCRWMAEGKTREAREARAAHPWGNEIVGAAHLGWIGGALNPRRTDWRALAKNGIETVYIVADNDDEGKSAISTIAYEIKLTTFSIEFTERFKVGFDLGDPFPDAMFREIDGQRFYIGPSMRTCLHPATWATDTIPNPAGAGRPLTILRDSFKKMWAYVEETDVYVCTEMPTIIRSEVGFNKMVAGFSHVNETARLLNKAYKGRTARLCYRPDEEGMLVDYRGSSAINLHVQPEIRPVPGDPKPWLDFLAYLFVNDEERKEAERWCATLIARPDIRMKYGLLLISEKQGIGKTTLGASILAPLVGEHNVGYPAEKDITSDFNEWVAHKRLAIVNEIYSGASWKAYHALKSVITDHEVTVNQKYMRQYTIDNWCHVLACSNSMRALKMEHDDRRWFYPEVTEVTWSGKKFTELRQWLSAGGLSIIKAWAKEFGKTGKYVSPSEHAPMTGRKMEMIEGSRSEAQAEAAALANVLKDHHAPAALLIKDVVGWVRGSVQGKVFDTDYELRRSMTEAGLRPYKDRIKVSGRLQYVLMNAKLADLVARTEEGAKEVVREHIVMASSLMEGDM